MTDSKTSSPVLSENVGYRRPPVGKRFRKGQSGNPAGRRKGSRNRRPSPMTEDQLGALVREEAYRLINIDQNGEDVRMPVVRAVLRSLIVAATTGDLRAQAAFLKMVSDSEASALPQDETLDHVTQQPHEVIIKIVDPPAPK